MQLKKKRREKKSGRHQRSNVSDIYGEKCQLARQLRPGKKVREKKKGSLHGFGNVKLLSWREGAFQVASTD